jgi:hypothetical protein
MLLEAFCFNRGLLSLHSQEKLCINQFISVVYRPVSVGCTWPIYFWPQEHSRFRSEKFWIFLKAATCLTSQYFQGLALKISIRHFPRTLAREISSDDRSGTRQKERKVFMDNFKASIRIEAARKCAKVEALFIDAPIPIEAMTLYRLLRALWLADLESYFREFGLLPIRAEDAQDGSLSLGFGSLTVFEGSICQIINDECERRQKESLSQICRTESGRHYGLS